MIARDPGLLRNSFGALWAVVALASVGSAQQATPPRVDHPFAQAYFYYRPSAADATIVLLPLAASKKDVEGHLIETIFATTRAGRSHKLSLEGIRDESPDYYQRSKAGDCAAGSATAIYRGDREFDSGQVVFFSREPLGIPADRIFALTPIEPKDPVLDQVRKQSEPSRGLTLACGDGPRLQAFRATSPSRTLILYEETCLDWGGDGTSGSEFFALYDKVDSALRPLYLTRRRSKDPEAADYGVVQFLEFEPRFVMDVDGNGWPEMILTESAGVSGETKVVEFRKDGYNEIRTVRFNEEGEPCDLAARGDDFLAKVRPSK